MNDSPDHTRNETHPARGGTVHQKFEEKTSWVICLPLLATGLFYVLPGDVQQSRLLQFVPQASAYLALVLWVRGNADVKARPFDAQGMLGLRVTGLNRSVSWGCATGVLLGVINTCVILFGVPAIGEDITFLRETPHAAMPTWFMVPWGVLGIAAFVELNFRAFLLGRLEVIFCRSLRLPCGENVAGGSVLAILGSALVFAFDPFMVMTFRHLHWIAVWDGLIWGWLWVRVRSLYAVILAHTIEVIIMYLSIKAVMT